MYFVYRILKDEWGKENTVRHGRATKEEWRARIQANKLGRRGIVAFVKDYHGRLVHLNPLAEKRMGIRNVEATA